MNFSYWDLQNQLILVSNFQFQVSNAYDAMGRRVRKSVSRKDAETQSWEVEKTCHFFYDGWNVIRETIQLNSLTPPNALTNYYTWGNDLSGSLQGAGGVGGLLAVSCVSSNTSYLLPLTYYPLYDHIGNVERYVSRNGMTVATFQYDTFGNTVSETFTQSGNNAFTHFRFSTKYWDAEAGLYYYGYRFYRPEIGRWVNRDPIGESYSYSLYVFIDNESTDAVDDLGLIKRNPGSRRPSYDRPKPTTPPEVTGGLPPVSQLIPSTPAGSAQEGVASFPMLLMEIWTKSTDRMWAVLKGIKTCQSQSPKYDIPPPVMPEFRCERPKKCCVINIIREGGLWQEYSRYYLQNAYVADKSCDEIQADRDKKGSMYAPEREPDDELLPW